MDGNPILIALTVPQHFAKLVRTNSVATFAFAQTNGLRGVDDRPHRRSVDALATPARR